MTSVLSFVSNCIRRPGLDCGADLGPVGEDLEGPGLARGVDLCVSSFTPVGVSAVCTDCFRLFDG